MEILTLGVTLLSPSDGFASAKSEKVGVVFVQPDEDDIVDNLMFWLPTRVESIFNPVADDLLNLWPHERLHGYREKYDRVFS